MASNAPAATDLHTSGFFNPIIDACEGCDRVIEANNTKYCQTYAHPDSKWRLGICNFATHKKPEITVGTTKINPLKASKRAAAGAKKKKK